MNETVDVPIRADEVPFYAHPGDAGADLRSTEELVLAPGERASVGTGVSIALPDGHVGFVVPRSGLAFKHGLTPILCVGEGLEVRKAGDQVSYTLAQVEAALVDVPAEQIAKVVIAYEPVWAIGTGEVATPEDAQEVCGAIRRVLAELCDQTVADSVRVLYGGSVKSGNVAAIMSQEDVDGALVGGASIDPAEFASICRYRDHLATS